jgi:hypothetical protein
VILGTKIVFRPGEKLVWNLPWPQDPFFEQYTVWIRKHGTPVEFVDYAGPEELHQQDVEGLPIIKVRTKVGICLFSAGFFI